MASHGATPESGDVLDTRPGEGGEEAQAWDSDAQSAPSEESRRPLPEAPRLPVLVRARVVAWPHHLHARADQRALYRG